MVGSALSFFEFKLLSGSSLDGFEVEKREKWSKHRRKIVGKVKREEIQKIIDDLTEDFVVVFWDTIEEIYHSVNYYERQGLVWKALYQKNLFLEDIK